MLNIFARFRENGTYVLQEIISDAKLTNERTHHRRQHCKGHMGPEPPRPQYLTCRGPSVCWAPAIIPTQSRVGCTIFVNIGLIDFLVSTVVEQVYIV